MSGEQLSLFEIERPPAPTPGECPYEEAVADIGKGKSYCGPWETWTNCREVGYCVAVDCGVRLEGR